MTDNIKPEHYRTGEIDLYEAFSQIFPHNEYRAGMQMIAMRYMFRDKVDRVEDLNKSIYTLERLKEKEIEQSKRTVKTPEEAIDDIEKSKFLLELGCKYLTRDKDGQLLAHEFPPLKYTTYWAYDRENKIFGVSRNNFPEVKWMDEEPTKISKLLAIYENGGENGK